MSRFPPAWWMRAGALVAVLGVLGGVWWFAAARWPQASPPTLAPAELATALLNEPDPGARRQLLRQHPPGTPRELAAALRERGLGPLKAGDFAEAIRIFTIALDAAVALDDVRGRALARTLLGQALARSGRLDDAYDQLEASLPEWRAGGDAADLGRALSQLGVTARMRGDLDDSIRWHEEALAIAVGAGDAEAQGARLNNIGNVHLDRGDYRSALAFYERSLAFKPEDDPSRASTLMNIGLLHAVQGQFAAAIDSAGQALAIRERRDDRAGLPQTLTNLATIHADVGDLVRADALATRALALARETGNQPHALLAEFQLARIRADAGDSRQSARLLESNVRAARSENNQPALVRALAKWSEQLLALGRTDEAVAAAAEASALGQRLGIARFTAAALEAYGNALGRAGHVERAAVELEASIAIVENERAHVAGDALERGGFLEKRLGPYHALARLQLDHGQPERALATLERARARALLDVVAPGAADARAVASQVNALVPAESPGLPAVDEPFPTGTLVVRYAVLPEATYLFAVAPARDTGSPPNLRVHRIDIAERALGQRTAAFRRAIAERHLGVNAQAVALFDLLLAPVRDLVAAAAHIVVVPDHVLWDVPFAALQGTPGRYLVEDIAIGYAPSLTAWQRLRARPTSRMEGGRLLLAVGSPWSIDGPSADAAPTLDDAVLQAETIAREYDGHRVTTLVGRGASEAAVVRQMPSHVVVHIAAHGLFDETSPLYSFVRLAPEATSRPDGRLEARELLAMGLRGGLLVLAGCETARGQVTRGEGAVGMAWAALVAGAGTVVVSRWNVEAGSTTLLMRGLHRGVAEAATAGAGADLATLLRHAALPLVGDPRYRHPFYWAGFSLIGSGVL